MSNPNVGSIYQQVIKDVIETSRVDFEEGGVDESVLDELAKGWQMKLSSLGVAQFPWDPKPEPVPAPVMNNAPPMASNYHMDITPQPQPDFSLPPLPSMPSVSDGTNGPRIKAEPVIENGLSLPSYNGGPGLTAQQRAAQNLQAQYGSRAAASINAIQTNLPQQGQQQQQQQQQRPSGVNQRPQMTQTQYQQAMADQTARQRSQMQNLGGAQTDGVNEMEGESIGIMKRFDEQGQEVEMGRIEIDHMIRQRIEAMGRRMEGGGLMLPLRERVPSSRSKKRKINSRQGSKISGVSDISGGLAPTSIPQFDGADDDEEDDDDKGNILNLDEDAINSDLDDSDDGLNDEEDDDEALGHIMLCMYDKVQRVKNKWKCVMKDGVLTVNGKEYVFHKASGEYEW